MSINAAFVTSLPTWRWKRQFPTDEAVFNNVKFMFDGNYSECDIVFVFDGIPLELAGRMKARRTVFVASEPAAIKTYHENFLSQFDFVLTTDPSTKHPGLILSQVGLPWHIGAFDQDGRLLSNPMNYKDFENFSPTKTKSLSVVASNKSYAEGHRARLEFVQKLKSYFGDEIDIFGRKINGFGDKSQVLNEYRYHIAIENSAYSHYWTEKLADPYLALTYPIYYGCPNINKYFSENSMTCIDIHDESNAIDTIRRLIDSDTAETSQAHLVQARKSVLNENNLFSILADLANHLVEKNINRPALECERYFTRRKYRLKRNGLNAIQKLASLRWK